MSDVDFRPIQEAGITQGEFASLLRVSRITVSNWVRGVGGIHEMRLPQVKKMLKALSRATRSGKLPLREMDRAKRLPAIKRALIEHLKAARD
jgi:transcriptional regulator with XRE-family HTH domain